jgi:pimeloyl-ACP methyl ester carboxylesterase
MALKVFVHGNPETPVIWRPLLGELGTADTVCLQLPGFGVPRPPGFGATKDEYVVWLGSQLDALVDEHGPVDLVGHDWGGGFVVEAVDQRPERVRSWASDVLGLFHPDYVWHDFAKIWQTPGAGEQYFADSNALPSADIVALFNSLGIPSPIADELVDAADEDMDRCILALYRSAAQPAMAEAGARLGAIASKPGLAIVATEDPFTSSSDLAPQVAQRLGATVHRLDQGHWWMLADPAGGAAMLRDFWDGVP